MPDIWYEIGAAPPTARKGLIQAYFTEHEYSMANCYGTYHALMPVILYCMVDQQYPIPLALMQLGLYEPATPRTGMVQPTDRVRVHEPVKLHLSVSSTDLLQGWSGLYKACPAMPTTSKLHSWRHRYMGFGARQTLRCQR